MWIRDVDFPGALIQAHRASNLVIFVGAGASRDAPSGLPDFRTLALGIASDAQAEATAREQEQLDLLLGRLADQQVDVHKRVAARIGVESSRPNRLHEAIIDLANAGPPVRIVTTNYDVHLSSVLTAWGI
jgi:NAD-dependent SIR2 family protein deacetylase